MCLANSQDFALTTWAWIKQIADLASTISLLQFCNYKTLTCETQDSIAEIIFEQTKMVYAIWAAITNQTYFGKTYLRL